MNEIMTHISSLDCPNNECPSNTKSTRQPQKGVVNHSSIWRAELRVRYIPSNLAELYETDKATCHFYFEQVSTY